MVTVASGQLSIVDLNDAKQLQLYIGSSQPRSQLYNPNNGTYTPNWSTTHPVLTPQLFIAGTSTDIITQAKTITWYEDGSSTAITSGTNYTVATTGAHALTINTNLMTSVNTKLITCEVVYTDSSTNYDVTAKADFEFVKVSTGTNGATGSAGANAINAFVWTPDGNVIKNSSGTLTAQCDLYNGATIQTSGVTYQWYVQDPTVSTDQGGGVGWGKLDSTHTYGGVTNYTTNKITIPSTAITDTEVFKCIATYSTKTYQDVCTVSDVTDPFLVVIVGANTFKNGQGTSTFEAKLYQAGAEIDADGTGGYTYTWYLYDANNNQVTTWNGTGSKTGKSITVNASDINSRANLLCEVTK